MTDQLLQLHHDLREAYRPDRDLDERLFRALGYYVAHFEALGHDTWHTPDGQPIVGLHAFDDPPPHLTGSVDEALDALPEGWTLDFIDRRRQPEMGGRMYRAGVRGPTIIRSGGQRTIPLAVCEALVRALIWLEDPVKTPQLT